MEKKIKFFFSKYGHVIFFSNAKDLIKCLQIVNFQIPRSFSYKLFSYMINIGPQVLMLLSFLWGH